MHETTDIAVELMATGFTKDEQKRGLLKWFIGFSMAANILLVTALISANKQERIHDERQQEMLHQIIIMQNNTQRRVDTLIQKF